MVDFVLYVSQYEKETCEEKRGHDGVECCLIGIVVSAVDISLHRKKEDGGCDVATKIGKLFSHGHLGIGRIKQLVYPYIRMLREVYGKRRDEYDERNQERKECHDCFFREEREVQPVVFPLQDEQE